MGTDGRKHLTQDASSFFFRLDQINGAKKRERSLKYLLILSPDKPSFGVLLVTSVAAWIMSTRQRVCGLLSSPLLSSPLVSSHLQFISFCVSLLCRSIPPIPISTRGPPIPPPPPPLPPTLPSRPSSHSKSLYPSCQRSLIPLRFAPLTSSTFQSNPETSPTNQLLLHHPPHRRHNQRPKPKCLHEAYSTSRSRRYVYMHIYTRYPLFIYLSIYLFIYPILPSPSPNKTT